MPDLTIRDYAAIEFAKVFAAEWRQASDFEITERSVSLADCMAQRLALGDPCEQILNKRNGAAKQVKS